MLDDVRIAGHVADLEVKLQISIQQVLIVIPASGAAHSIQCALQFGHIRILYGSDTSSNAFERATEFVQIDHIVFAEIDNARTAARELRDESVRGENIDGLPYGSLGNTESAGAGSFNDSHTRLHGAAYDLSSQFGGKGMLH
jgi:hypothetical protein